MRSDPRSNAALAPPLVGALCGALVAARFETAIGCLALGAALALASGARFRGGPGLALFASGAAISLALNLYLVDGAPIAGLPEVFGRHATFAGLTEGALLALRVAGAGVALLGLGALWPGERGIEAIARALRPLGRIGLPVAESRLVAALAWRMRPAVAAEAERVAQLQELRAGRAPRGWSERWSRARARLVPSLTGSLERAERVALALEARHYRLRPAASGARSPWPAKLAGVAIAAVSLVWRG
jgi:energy-coupling factor transporter transmembrane protein EcfT